MCGSLFVGQDGTRAFVTGDFTPAGLISDVSGLKPDDYLGLVHWLEFYIKTYTFVGKRRVALKFQEVS